MKRLVLSGFLTLLTAEATFAADAPAAPAGVGAKPGPGAAAAPASSITDPKERLSYAIGFNIGSSLKMQGAEVSPEVIATAIRETMAGGKTAMSREEVMQTLQTWQMEMRNKRDAKSRELGDKNKKDGETFLAANAQKPGVKSMPSGLQYKVIQTGTGPQPKATDTVSAHYRGTLLDGTEFDSSYTKGQPLKMPVNRLIMGWQEALTNMHVGDKWTLYVPSNLAYGERGAAGGTIGPNATLQFEMELLGIEPPAPTPTPGPGLTPSIQPGPGGLPPRTLTPQPK